MRFLDKVELDNNFPAIGFGISNSLWNPAQINDLKIGLNEYDQVSANDEQSNC